jgi:hypothetical protein
MMKSILVMMGSFLFFASLLADEAPLHQLLKEIDKQTGNRNAFSVLCSSTHGPILDILNDLAIDCGIKTHGVRIGETCMNRRGPHCVIYSCGRMNVATRKALMNLSKENPAITQGMSLYYGGSPIIFEPQIADEVKVCLLQWSSRDWDRSIEKIQKRDYFTMDQYWSTLPFPIRYFPIDNAAVSVEMITFIIELSHRRCL